jgi:peptidoglycan/LPS O-acetylase OafA/YrhL
MQDRRLSEEQELQKRSSQPRLFQLDALRGIAAVTVVFNHLFLAFPVSASKALGLISNGRSAVVLFFVLSGYVLSMPVWKGRQMPYGLYLIRRSCRIYLPFAAAAALSIMGAAIFHNIHLQQTSWFNQTWQTPITLHIVVKQFLMVPMNDFNTAFWSLTYEMQMSIVMPLLCLLMLWTSPAAFTMFYGLVVFAHPMNPYGSTQYPALSYQIVFLFLLGAILARYAGFLKQLCERLGLWLWLALAASIYLYYDFIINLSSSPTLTQALSKRIFLINGLGSAGILICSLHLPPLARLLKHSVPEYLGRISYSLYLVHGIVLFATIYLLAGHLRGRWMTGVVLILAFAAAHLFCITVEEPAMRLGKRLCEAIQRRQRRLLKNDSDTSSAITKGAP